MMRTEKTRLLKFRVTSREFDRAGFTLIELLVVVAIIGVLVALLLPAVQQARESARRTQCRNNLKQVATAWMEHEEMVGHLPTGGWGWLWIGRPDGGFGRAQGGGWVYNILPFVDQDPLWKMGGNTNENLTRVRTAIGTFNCPTRRHGAYSCGASLAETGVPGTSGKMDYAANCGDQSLNEYFAGPPDLATGLTDNWSGWHNTATLTGVCFERSQVKFKDITDGASNTYMTGEKYLNPANYYNGADGADNEAQYSGFNNDNYRTGASTPMQDTLGFGDTFRFGSAHVSAFHMGLCDGSVRSITYNIDINVHRNLANRYDNNPIGDY